MHCEIGNVKLHVLTLLAFPIQHFIVYYVVCIIIVTSLYDVEMLKKTSIKFNSIQIQCNALAKDTNMVGVCEQKVRKFLNIKSHNIKKNTLHSRFHKPY